MTRIDNTQQLMMLVRQQLSRASRSNVARTGKINITKPQAETQSTSKTMRLSDYSEEEMQRALVHEILTEEFGEAIINEASFQQIVDRITKQLQSNSDTASLLSASLSDISKPS